MSPRDFGQQALRLMFQAERRRQLRTVAARLRNGFVTHGAALEPADCMLAFHVLDDVLAGYDPRRDLGIRPKSGVRSRAKSRNECVAAYFLRLKLDHPEVGDKHHYARVTGVTGFAEARLRKLVSVHRQEATSLAQGMSADALLEVLRKGYGFPHSPRESRKK
jgi:hypothetical protein